MKNFTDSLIESFAPVKSSNLTEATLYTPEAIKTRNIVRQIAREDIANDNPLSADDWVDFADECEQKGIEATKDLFDIYTDCLVNAALGYNIKDESLENPLTEEKLEEKVPHDLAVAIKNTDVGRRFGSFATIDFENSDFKEITKDEAAKEIAEGNAKNIFGIRPGYGYAGKNGVSRPEELARDFSPKYIDWCKDHGEFDPTEDYTKFYLLTNKVERPDADKRMSPSYKKGIEDTGKHLDPRWQIDKQELRDYRAGAGKDKYGWSKINPIGTRGSADAVSYMGYNRYALSVDDLQKRMTKMRNALNRLHSAQRGLDKVQNFDDKKATARDEKISKLEAQIAELQAQLDEVRNTPAETIEPEEITKAKAKVDELTAKVRNILGRDTTESLDEDIIDEATLNWYDQERKMDAWHNGTRGCNVKACDNSKLQMNWQICKNKGYTNEAQQLEAEGRARGLAWAQPKPAPQPQPQQPITITNIEKAINNMTLKPVHFDSGLAGRVIQWEKTNTPESCIAWCFGPNGNTFEEKVRDAMICLIHAAIFNCSAVYKDLLTTLGVDDHPGLKTAIKNLFGRIKADDKIKETLEAIKKEIASTATESLNEETVEEKMEKHDTLNPILFDENNHLRPEVREKLLQIADEFIKGIKEDEVKFNLQDVKVVGSNASYNYNPDSDLDLHLVAETKSLKCPDDLYPIIYNLYKAAWNNKFTPTIKGIPVELYVETEATEQPKEEVTESVEDTKRLVDEEKDAIDSYQKAIDNPETTESEKELYQHIQDEEVEHQEELEAALDGEEEPIKEAVSKSALVSNGIYSVLDDKWLKEPVAGDVPEVNQEEIDKALAPWLLRYNEIVKEPTVDAIEKFMDDLYTARQTSISTEGEYNPTNHAFKSLRAAGHLDELREIKRLLKEKEMSLE